MDGEKQFEEDVERADQEIDRSNVFEDSIKLQEEEYESNVVWKENANLRKLTKKLLGWGIEARGIDAHEQVCPVG